jgi:hypothetical protein
MLFYPPNVAGWPGGRTWIDSSTLMMRMRLPQLINDEDEWNVKPKDDDDQMMGRPAADNKPKPSKNMGGKPIIANVDWKEYMSYFDKVQRDKLVNAMAGILLQTNTAVSADIIRQYSDESSRENFIRSATIQIMSTPEYQLC